MRIKNLTFEQLKRCIDAVNAAHGTKIITTEENVRGNGRFIQFRVRVISGRDPYAARAPVTWRRTVALCYHGHFLLYREIFKRYPDAQIHTALANYTAENFFERATQVGYKEVGSRMSPATLMNCCECPHSGTAPIT